MCVFAIHLTPGYPRTLGRYDATAFRNVPRGQFYQLIQTGHGCEGGGFPNSPTLAIRRWVAIKADGPFGDQNLGFRPSPRLSGGADPGEEIHVSMFAAVSL